MSDQVPPNDAESTETPEVATRPLVRKPTWKIWRNNLIFLAIFGLILGGIGIGITRAIAITSVEIYEQGYKFNRWNGKITVIDHKGWAFYIPLVEIVNTVDLRPYQVCLNANARVLNCKLVKFNSRGLEIFISWHGRRDYDGTSDAQGDLKDILRSYALSGGTLEDYPFLEIQRELKTGTEVKP